MDDGLQRDDGASHIEYMRYYIDKVRAINEEKFKRTGKRPTMCCVTFGCQMNAHDSEKLIGMLMDMGYERTDSEDEAGLIVYNTCCVRENAENKVFGNLGYLKHRKETEPDLKVVLCGCMMQQDAVIEKIKKTYRNVDIIFGTFNTHRFPELLSTHLETGGTVIDVWKEHQEIVEDLPAVRECSFKAGINIMYGCNNFCSYCIVPYVRGRERSREMADILREAGELAKSGAKEIMLLGQNVNSYGKSLSEPVSFAKLLREINAIDGIERIRFMTSHPKDLSDELISAMADCEKVCKHLHLPVQSGSTEILERMNRRYTKEKYLGLIEKIREKIPGIAVTTDIIVGFPGETEENFQDTLDVVRRVRYSGAFTFQYSVRTGTPAATMADHVPEKVISRRFAELLSVLNPIIYENNKSRIGNTVMVLAEEVNRQDSGLITGRTDDNAIIHFNGSEDMIGKIFPVEVTDCKTFYLLGRVKDRL